MRARLPARRLAAALAPVTALACALLGTDPDGPPAPTGPLPRDVVPLHYDLELAIDPEAEHFTGRLTLRLRLEQRLRAFWLHARELEVEESWLESEGTWLPAPLESAHPSGVARVTLPREVGPGEARLRVAWRAPLRDDLRGLYRVRVDERAYAFTQLEPIAARLVFPGFDEPSFKTPFSVSLVVPEGHVAITNGPAEDEETLPDGRRRVRFAETPPLPTYLVAFAVGPLDVVPAAPLRAGPGFAVPFRGVAAKGRGDELAYALEHTPPLLAFLEAWFGLPYPYAKLDLVAVPEMAFGAMEHPGAITFRESILLVDPETAPVRQVRLFHRIDAHELAHQWFGNLVTPRWWDDLWLNEAFATWMASRAVEGLRPEQNAALSFAEHVRWAMQADSLVSARRIRQPVEDTHDIRNAFDSITYEKGAGVLAMFERWLGRDVFQRGIRQYLRAHAGGTATTADLLAALEAVSGRAVAEPFSSFLDQPGVPFLETELRCEEDGAELRLRQSRYLPVGSRGDRDATWQIPVCARYGAGGRDLEACGLLASREGRIPLAACPEWLVPNAEATGYYRFAPPPDAEDPLDAAGFAGLSAPERLAVADSLAASFRAAAVPPEALYGALPKLARDESRAIAEVPLEPLEFAIERAADDALRPEARAFAHAVLAPVWERLSWDPRPGESGEARLLREAVLEHLVYRVRDPGLRAEAARRGRLHAGLGGSAPQRDAVDAELAEIALGVAVQEGGDAVFDALAAALAGSEDALARRRRLAALGRAEAPETAQRARELALDPRVRSHEALWPLWSQTGQPETRAAAWDWVRAHWDALAVKVGESQASHMPWLAGGFCSEERARSVEAFLALRAPAIPGAPRNAAAAVEAIRLCAALRETQGPGTRAFLRARTGGPGA